MDYNNLQLRNKTFLDFKPTNAALDEIIGGHAKSDKEFFLRSVSPENAPASEDNRVMTFMAFAEICDDEKLAAAIRAEFAAEYNAIFNE